MSLNAIYDERLGKRTHLLRQGVDDFYGQKAYEGHVMLLKTQAEDAAWIDRVFHGYDQAYDPSVFDLRGCSSDSNRNTPGKMSFGRETMSSRQNDSGYSNVRKNLIEKIYIVFISK